MPTKVTTVYNVELDLNDVPPEDDIPVIFIAGLLAAIGFVLLGFLAVKQIKKKLRHPSACPHPPQLLECDSRWCSSASRR
jgi:hypothetical protein